jgi:hypothetical protein
MNLSDQHFDAKPRRGKETQRAKEIVAAFARTQRDKLETAELAEDAENL